MPHARPDVNPPLLPILPHASRSPVALPRPRCGAAGTPDNFRLVESTLCANPSLASRVTLYPVGLNHANASCEVFTDRSNQGNGIAVCDEDAHKRGYIRERAGSFISRGM